ncbi:hypothetical protein D3C85_1318550 [compost metagenome]
MAVDPKALGLGLGTNKAVELIAAQFDAAVQQIEGASAFSVTGVVTPLFTVANTADTAGIVDYLAALTAALQDAGVI